MRVLHVMKGCPFPPKGGIESDIWNRLVTMHRLGYLVHVVMTTRKAVPDALQLAQVRRFAYKVDLVQRVLTPASVFTSAPSLVATNRALTDLPLEDRYDLALAESENMTPVFDNPALQARMRVIRVHNDEGLYYSTMAKAEERPHWKVFFAVEAMRFKHYSLNAFRRADGIWFISKLERDRITGMSPDLAPRSIWLPPAIEFRTAPARRTVGRPNIKAVLIVGSLNVSLNREGIRWYIRNVHPALLSDAQYRLIIAGGTRGSANAKRFSAKIAATGRCEVHVDIEDLTPLYERASVIVNPMQRGAGVKLKTIHAVQERLPLVTTSVGAEGSGFRDSDHVRIEDDPCRFALVLKEILNHPEEAAQMARRAYQFLCEHYEQSSHIQEFVHNRLGPRQESGQGARMLAGSYR